MRAVRKQATIECRCHRDEPLWQDGYHERVLRDEETTRQVIDYMLNNPVRAGLVQNAIDYPFSWSADHEATAGHNPARPTCSSDAPDT